MKPLLKFKAGLWCATRDSVTGSAVTPEAALKALERAEYQKRSDRLYREEREERDRKIRNGSPDGSGTW